ncbi:hypothetical protein WR25_09311 [Diploscapter pachys]|uniref:Beta-1,4-N-acetylgalactosaminyltransferase n=1 Tax=Diploscapter pachys TaxID=2018661 RepID=A0A2A2L554_9BILA|nr:hypothetical protein WR25_09311 [Diploscapter pachys]
MAPYVYPNVCPQRVDRRVLAGWRWCASWPGGMPQIPSFVGGPLTLSYVEMNPFDEVLLNTATNRPLLHTRKGISKKRSQAKSTTVSIRPESAEGLSKDDFDRSKNYSFTLQKRDLEYCPNPPPNLVGPIRVFMDGPSMEQMIRIHRRVENGGHGFPKDCRARHRVGIVVPYRDRESHLRIFLHNLHLLLKKQQIDYVILVVEPIANQTFNRAKLMNIGYSEGLKLYPFQCFIFHDVDLLPEDDRNLYSCPVQPRHMSVAVDKFNYALPYKTIFGGISALTIQHMQTINGFSNNYWGWGGEDDDLSTRAKVAGLNIFRYPQQIARYKMIKHGNDIANPINYCRFKLMARTEYRYKKDGLNTLRYDVVAIEKKPLYTRILVDLREGEERENLKLLIPQC